MLAAGEDQEEGLDKLSGGAEVKTHSSGHKNHH